MERVDTKLQFLSLSCKSSGSYDNYGKVRVEWPSVLNSNYRTCDLSSKPYTRPIKLSLNLSSYVIVKRGRWWHDTSKSCASRSLICCGGCAESHEKIEWETSTFAAAFVSVTLQTNCRRDTRVLRQPLSHVGHKCLAITHPRGPDRWGRP